MDKPRPCGCKGCRTCLLCEKDFNLNPKQPELDKSNSYVYCPDCNKAWPGWTYPDLHPNHTGNPIEYSGVYIQKDFLSISEETELLAALDSMPWDVSQSGRTKQNFGPKCNFKKRKLRLGNFCGFPKTTEFVQKKFKRVGILENFQTIEQCSLEYDPIRGASIDPHIDDCWIWGERIVTVNLQADSILTMTYNDKPNRYNLDWVARYPTVVENGDKSYKVKPMVSGQTYPIVRIPMPRRSLLVMYGAARYDWEHQILREDIHERRVCLAYREFTPPYLKGGEFYEEAKQVFEEAKRFWEYTPLF